jgi:phage N-6-adenine-methyltransferase
MTIGRLIERKRLKEEIHAEMAVEASRKMPKQKPGLSKQDYSTPPEFIDAVKKRFGITRFDFDLAAVKSNAIDNLGLADLYLGPDHANATCRDALSFDWSRTPNGNLWLNPPYSHIEPWASKCSGSAWFDRTMKNSVDRRIFFLVPAAVGSNWFARHVDGKALVLLLNGRLSFDGVSPFPKDNLLAVYGAKPSYEVWAWKK